MLFSSTSGGNLDVTPSSPGMAAGGTSKSSCPAITSSSITSDPHGLETGGGSSSTGPTQPPKPIAEDRPDAMRGLEENASYRDAVEEECRRKLGTGGAYLGTPSRNRIWEKLQRTSEQSNRLRERKVKIMKALLAKCANGDSSGNDDHDDGEDNSGDDDDGDDGGRGRFGISLDSIDSALRIRPPTPPLPARAQPKISPIFPRVDARPIGECKSSWGGDHHGGRARVEARVPDVRVASRGRDISGAGKAPGPPPFLGVGTKYRPPPPSRVVGSPNRQQGHTSLAKHPPRDDPVSPPGGTSASTSRNFKNREDGKKRGGNGDGGGRGNDGGGGSGRPLQRDGKRHDKDTLARKSGDRKQGKGDRDHRERSKQERFRTDGIGDKRRRSVSSSVDRGRSNRREKKARANRRSASRERSSSRAGGGRIKFAKHRGVSGESTRSPTYRKRRRRSSSDDCMEGITSGGSGSPPASHTREIISPRRVDKNRDPGVRRAVSAPMMVASATILPLR